MTDFTCPECNGTGVYQGLNTVEPCRACGGKKDTEVVNEVCRDSPKFEWDRSRYRARKAAQQFSGQSIRHEIEEQTAEESSTIHISLDGCSKSECHRDYYEIDRGHWAERHPYSTVYVTLTEAIFNPEEYRKVWDAVTSGEFVTLKVSDDPISFEKTVRITSFEIGTASNRANLTLEVGDA